MNFEENLFTLGHSEAYVNLVMLANRVGAKWLNLDCDADIVEFLPVFTW